MSSVLTEFEPTGSTKSLEDAQRWKKALEAEIQVADKSIVPGITRY
jgi:hypothetical protein